MVATERLKRAAPVVILLAAVFAIALVNPVGYVGGGADDSHYLDAARCWLQAGMPCLPNSHWWTRWPVIAPLAASIRIAGESRMSVGIASALWWAVAVLLLARLGQQWFNRTAGLIAAFILATVPVVASAAFEPNADIPELAAQLAALLAATIAYQRQSRWWAVAAGIAAAVALEARDTSLIFCGVAALSWLFLPRDRRTVLLWAAPGLVGAAIAEMAGYYAAMGDPLFRYRLALNHIAIPTGELPPGFDLSQGPLFNPHYIAAWKRDQDIHAYWIADPWLNLIASPRLGRAIFAAAIVWLLARSWIQASWRKSLWLLNGAALLVAALLIYGLAIDPKPRMFMLLAVSSSMTIGVGVAAAWDGGRKWLPAAVTAMLALVQIGIIAQLPSTRAAEARARTWIANDPDKIEIDAQTLSALALVPDAQSLPRPGSGRALRIASTGSTCAQMLKQSDPLLSSATLVEAVPASARGGGEMCLFRLRRANRAG